MTMLVEQEEILATPLPKAPPSLPRIKEFERLSFKQALELADGRPFELIDGRMVFKMPDDLHSEVQSLLCAELVNYFKKNRIGRVRTEHTHRLWPDNPHESRVPDLSVILNENLRTEERYATRAPDLVIEIISRDDKWTELFDKAVLYFEKGSREVWLVDPYQEILFAQTSSPSSCRFSQ